MADVQAYLFIILTLLISTLLIRAFFKSTSSKRRLPPSPFAIPIIGHLHLFAPVPHQGFHKLSLRYGPVIRLLMGSVPCVVVGSPDAAKEFLKTCENSFLDRPYNSATERLTYGSKDFAFANHGFYWKFMKKIVMTQLLSGATIDLLHPLRQHEINRFYKSLCQKASTGKALYLSAEFVKVSSNLISTVLLGQRCSENEEEAEDIRKLIFEITEVVGAFNLSDNIWLFKNLDLQGFGKRVKDIHRRFDAFVEKIISEHEEERKQKRGSQGNDILNMLMDIAEAESMEVELTRENIKAFIMNILVPGSDNVALASEWGLAELINHPDVMKKARAEIDQVVGTKRLLQESDVPNLPYLQAFVKETLRLHPPVPMVPRQSSEERTVAGFHIPANTTIFVNVWALGRDPNSWENPLEFRPDRFLEKHMEVRGQHFDFLPFGSGKRSCPGASLGLKLVYTTVGIMIQCFDWKAGIDGNLTRVDMEEAPGFNLPRANPLICIPVARLDPMPIV